MKILGLKKLTAQLCGLGISSMSGILGKIT